MKPFRSLRLAPSALLAAVLIQAAGSLASPPPPPLESIWINLGGLIAIPGNPPVYKMHFVFSYGGTTFYDQWATPGYNPTSLNQRPTQGFARGQKLTLTATLYDATTGAQLGSATATTGGFTGEVFVLQVADPRHPSAGYVLNMTGYGSDFGRYFEIIFMST